MYKSQIHSFFLAPYSEYNVTVNARTKVGDGILVGTIRRTIQSSNSSLIEALNIHNHIIYTQNIKMNFLKFRSPITATTLEHVETC